tara:strand:+ start:186 stop:1370 length:1185 start_codon:yes stop_codon:yes gene_type:complete
MGDILKEAIADAKAVRETALQNAKVALEEAFTPKIKSMLSAKLKEDDLDELSYEEEEPGEEEDEEEPEEMMSKDEIAYEDEEEHDDDEEVDEMSMKDEIKAELKDEIKDEIKTELKYEEEDEDHGDDEEEVEEISDLDLESVIKELESELSEGEDEDEDDKEDIDESDNPYDRNDQHDDLKSAPAGTAASVDKEKFEEGTEDDEDTVDESTDDDIEIDESVFEEDEDTVDEQSTSSGIGKGTGVKVATSSDEEDPGKNEDKPGDAKPFSETVKSLKSELKEYKEAVVFLKDKLHEVNILNAKLLFTNKVFKEFALDNQAKLKIVENFDRAQTVREIKLVYATLCENLNESSRVVKKKSIKESASSKSGSTKPSKKVITEEAEVANRFKKLAGLL